jgi:hypothetical protein
MYLGLSQQSKHSRDIAAILKSKKNELDVNYIEQWVARLGLSSVWKEMLDNVSCDPVTSTMECRTSKSGMIEILGIQFSTQSRIV